MEPSCDGNPDKVEFLLNNNRVSGFSGEVSIRQLSAAADFGHCINPSTKSSSLLSNNLVDTECG